MFVNELRAPFKETSSLEVQCSTRDRHVTPLNSLEHWLINAMCFSGSNPIVSLSSPGQGYEAISLADDSVQRNPHPQRMLEIGGGFHFEVAPNLAHSFTWSSFSTEFRRSQQSAKGVNLNDN